MSTLQSDRVGIEPSSLAIKAPCRVATTAAITLNGLQTVDGLALATGDRVLVKNQADTTTNGIYVANTSDWSRDVDFDGNTDFTQGTLVPTVLGTTNANTMWQVTTAGTITLGTSLITFANIPLVGSAGPAGATGPAGSIGSTGGTQIPYAIAGGTVDALTGTFNPVTPTLDNTKDGFLWRVRAAGANVTTTPTFAPDGQGPYTIKKAGASAVAAGDISAANAEILLSFVYNGGTSYVELLNPAGTATNAADSTISSNVSGGTAPPANNTLSAILDHILGSTVGKIIFRDTGGWSTLAIGTLNQLLSVSGAGKPSWATNPGNFAVRGDNISEFTNDSAYITAATSFAAGYGTVYSYTVASAPNFVYPIAMGATKAGSELTGTGAVGDLGLTGIWRCMSSLYTSVDENNRYLWQRIS